MMEDHCECITIPKSFDLRAYMLVENEGNQAKNLKNGDLLLQIKIKQHNVFEVDGNNLVMVKKVPYYTMMLGGVIEIEIIDATKRLLKIEGEGKYEQIVEKISN